MPVIAFHCISFSWLPTSTLYLTIFIHLHPPFTLAPSSAATLLPQTSSFHTPHPSPPPPSPSPPHPLLSLPPQPQYIFVYAALCEALESGNTVIECENFNECYAKLMVIDPTSRMSPLQEEFQVISLSLVH